MAGRELLDELESPKAILFWASGRWTLDFGQNKSECSMNDEPTEGTKEPDAELQEGLDYYLENGLLVFTAVFLLRRGYCCESGCRHCPYQNREP